MKKTIQIPQGNEFSLFVPFVVLSKNGREDASAALWNNVQVIVRMSNKQTDIPHTTALQEQYVVISFDNSLKLGSYDVIISGEYEGRNVSAPLNNLFSVTNWADGNYAEFVVGQPIECPTQTIIGQFNTTQDIIDLTEELRAALAAAEAAREEYEEKVAELEDVAQQSTLTDGIETLSDKIDNIDVDLSPIEQAIDGIDDKIGTPATGQQPTIFKALANINIDTTTIAKQGNNAAATLTDTQAAVKDGNDTAISVAKEIRSEVGTGSDTAAETGTLFAVVKWVKDKVKSIFNLIGSPATGQPATLFAAIAAGGGGGGGDAQESTSQAILADLQSLIDKNMITRSINGYISSVNANTIIDLIIGRANITSITDENVIFWPNSYNNGLTSLAYVSIPNATEISLSAFNNFANLIEIHAPNVSVIGNYFCARCANLRILEIPKVTDTSGDKLKIAEDVNLILLRIGSAMTNSFSLQYWSPTNALMDNNSTLVDSGETFSSNLEKLLYNIRTYIAAELRTDVGNNTITFSSAVKAAITADPTTYNSFPSNWTIS